MPRPSAAPEGRSPRPAPPLADRAALADWALQLIRPAAAQIRPGSGRLDLGAWGADYDADAAEMEAFVRPLWGLAPLCAAGHDGPEAQRFLRGIAAGTDPAHRDYWGAVGPSDQRMVEMAGIAFAWLLAPEQFWQPLSDAEKDRAAQWMRQINDQPPSDNNWLFFRVLVNLALARLGRDWSRSATEAALDRLESFHLGDGWYRDGMRQQIDYYTPMAFHFYGLLLARYGAAEFPEAAQRFRDRARQFAQGFQSFFAADGAAIPFGRSMTYRMAQSAFWAACAFAGEEVLPWPRLKALLLRNLRWWAGQQITDRDGVLSVGYAYANPLISEGYNGLGAPAWGLKSVLVLALGDHHPFWRAAEEPGAALPEGETTLPAAGFLLQRAGGQCTLLTGGQDARQFRGCDAKYGGFAYGTASPFSVPSDASQPERPEMSAMDNGLSVSRDGLSWLRRGRITEAGLRDGMAWGCWAPDARLRIESWCVFAGPGWHLRLHRIVTEEALQLAESGFAVDRSGTLEEQREEGALRLVTDGFTSGLVSLSGDRTAEVLRAAPNTNLRFPRTVIPRLTGRVPAGETLVATAVLGWPGAGPMPAAPELPERFRACARRLGLDLPPRTGQAPGPTSVRAL